MINTTDYRCVVVQFCYNWYVYRPSWTPLSPITITYKARNLSKRLTRLNMSPAKTGGYARDIPHFSRIINTMASIWLEIFSNIGPWRLSVLSSENVMNKIISGSVLLSVTEIYLLCSHWENFARSRAEYGQRPQTEGNN